MVFSAIAFVISSSHLPLSELPKVQSYYEPNRDNKQTSKQTAYRPLAQTHIDLGKTHIDLGKKTIERIMHTHYGYLEISNQGTILLVLPWDVTKIREEMIAKLPITHLTSEAPELPKVQSYYEPNRDNKETSKQTAYRPLAQTHIDLGKKTIERIMHTHYGYLEISNQGAILLVLPWDVTKIREEMIAKLPITHLTSEAPITPKEQADSMMVLMQFHEYVCQVAEVDPGMIAEILLLLRRCYGFKRHASGQLFYVRAVGIAQWVATWIFHSPKPIYASLLYDLVRYTRLPLSYIKANYNRGIFCFVENVLNIDQHQEMAKSLLYVTNRFKEAINQDHLSVLYIKLAERLYDLRYAKNYNNLEAVRQMAKETLTVDIELAKKYLESEIAKELETAAKQALAFCNAAVQAD
ncbi:HD domain-containing protein [Candidatus Cardinium hertigii]|uniref:HD domain-containing protein n=1 Tax=Candidatus Cardinium hertigii TaxID=247481 RepID=A0A3N2QCP0_9BACT|nr:HD domain-containing protein [Candidatus Cardinium hertigii]ROT47548.1 HD domain-containing protein [Candidatus Cardinium hertigii]